ncbi:response regulator transcription factor [Pedobacter psychroterrae]|uniref:Response regulator transcription factor n=1 Tax=Pedobacter psychroterrae TaxID=2530453 RepID=A0A4R0NEX4_9SPHI|nr:response regulator transcription factor [Pedobacter psychroterrae]TCC99001.1 response regulator transcription factor [Pedobacter psychroterrae]
MPIRIAIADDHKIFRTGLIAVLKDVDEFNVVLEAGSGTELIEQIATEKPDLILMDIKMPDMDGLQTTLYIREHFEDIKILVISMYHENKYIIDMMKAGANGYLLKNAEPKEIIQAINTVYHTGFYFNQPMSGTLMKDLLGLQPSSSSQSEAVLNEREIDVLKLICEERSNVEIADKLCLSVRTVEGYRTKLFEKIGSKNIVGLVLYAVKQGIVPVK